MAENDFYTLNGNSYRGTRYANFAGGGTDAQGNVSSAVNENAANDVAQSGNKPTTNPTDVPQQTAGLGVVPPKIETPPTMGEAATDMAIGGVVPSVATTIGSAAGTSLASNIGFGKALDMGVSGALNKVSGGLLGTASSSTNSALASMGSKFGPATQASVGKAATGAGVGGAIGSGAGTFAATMLTGGSFKDAAKAGIGSGIGFALGNAIMPGIGGFVGSTLGSMAAGMIGGGIKRESVSGAFKPTADGKYQATTVGGKGTNKEQQSKYTSNITNILNSFSDAIGLKYKAGFSTHSNIGEKDQKTAFITDADHAIGAKKSAQKWQGAHGAMKNFVTNNGQSRLGRERLQHLQTKGGKVSQPTISKNAGDVGAVALKVLQNSGLYSMGADQQVNDFWSQNVGKAKSITQLGQMVDNFLATRNNGPSQSLIALQNEGKSKYNFAS